MRSSTDSSSEIGMKTMNVESNPVLQYLLVIIYGFRNLSAAFEKDYDDKYDSKK